METERPRDVRSGLRRQRSRVDGYRAGAILKLLLQQTRC